MMTNPLTLVQKLDITSPTPRPKRKKPKPRRQRRAEARANLKSAKLNQRKAG